MPGMRPRCIVGLLYRDVVFHETWQGTCVRHRGAWACFFSVGGHQVLRFDASRWCGAGDAGVAPTSAVRQGTRELTTYPRAGKQVGIAGGQDRRSFATPLAVLAVALLAFVLADAAARWPNFNPDES